MNFSNYIKVWNCFQKSVFFTSNSNSKTKSSKILFIITFTDIFERLSERYISVRPINIFPF